MLTAFDALTFSRDFIDRVDELIDVFNVVSKDQLFTGNIDINSFTHSGCIYETLPTWFSKTGLNTIAEWIVSHFEVRILKLWNN